MRKTGITLLLVLAALFLCLTAAAEDAEPLPPASETAEEAEWTVMLYMCGSDLESRFSYATGNLEEISSCELPYANSIALAAKYGYEVTRDMLPDPGKVNVVIETGGCRAWHAQRLGLNISNRKLQRWSFEQIREDGSGGFQLEEELSLASMADPETLRDFIAWSDELFDNDIMYLYELGMALRDSGVQLDTVLFDACLMANFETAYIIKDYAKYMVASEEVVAGQGTAIGR